ncbi:MAG: septum formation protein Maf [Rhodobacterales bacterium]|nr:septum formation protein Maf [Rhodobacterales bacterium]
MHNLILASTSPFRRQMLVDLGIVATGVAPEVDEEPGELRDPLAVAQALALRKAVAVAARYPGDWVLGADQVAYDPTCPEEHWGKPEDAADHLRQLQRIRGRSHCLVTGWALLGPGFRRISHCVTTLYVRADLSDQELEQYVQTEEGRYCAAGYAAEGQGGFLFERIDGDWFNVLGLPVLDVISALREQGWRFGGRHEG